MRWTALVTTALFASQAFAVNNFVPTPAQQQQLLDNKQQIEALGKQNETLQAIQETQQQQLQTLQTIQQQQEKQIELQKQMIQFLNASYQWQQQQRTNAAAR